MVQELASANSKWFAYAVLYDHISRPKSQYLTMTISRPHILVTATDRSESGVTTISTRLFIPWSTALQNIRNAFLDPLPKVETVRHALSFSFGSIYKSCSISFRVRARECLYSLLCLEVVLDLISNHVPMADHRIKKHFPGHQYRLDRRNIVKCSGAAKHRGTASRPKLGSWQP